MKSTIDREIAMIKAMNFCCGSGERPHLTPQTSVKDEDIKPPGSDDIESRTDTDLAPRLKRQHEDRCDPAGGALRGMMTEDIKKTLSLLFEPGPPSASDLKRARRPDEESRGRRNQRHIADAGRALKYTGT